MNWQSTTFGVVGGGNMAEALLRGVLASGLIPAGNVRVYDPVAERRALFAGLGMRAAENAAEALAAEVVLLAVKPQVMADALAGAVARAGQLFISIAAGIRTDRLEALLSSGARVVRVMPNTPLLVGKGMSAICPGSTATAEDVRAALQLFVCGGDAVEVTEEAMDAVTALSGSGPAYVFRFAEALFAAGEAMGLSPELSRRLAIGTIQGAAEMLVRDPDAAELRRRVTSPGGTTAAALGVFEQGGLEELVGKALAAACERGRELGRGQS